MLNKINSPIIVLWCSAGKVNFTVLCNIIIFWLVYLKLTMHDVTANAFHYWNYCFIV